MNSFKLVSVRFLQMTTLTIILSGDLFAGPKEKFARRGKDIVTSKLTSAEHAAQDFAGSDQDSWKTQQAAKALAHKCKQSLNKNGKRENNKK